MDVEYFRNGLICDVALITKDGGRTPANRNKLSDWSDYFRAMFTNEMKEHDQSEVLIHGVSGDVLNQLIEYCYTSQIDIADQDVENVLEIMKAAAMLQFTEVQDICEKRCNDLLDATNCLAIWKVASPHNIGQLARYATDYVLDHFVEVSQSDEFLQSTVDVVSEFLKHDEININEEEDVIRALLGWINYDVANRSQEFNTLLQCVRFQQIKETVSKCSLSSYLDWHTNFLRDCLTSNLLFCPVCLIFTIDHDFQSTNGVFLQCLKFGSPNSIVSIVERRAVAVQDEVRRHAKSHILLIYDQPSGVSVDRYCTRLDRWTQVKTIRANMIWFDVVHHNGQLIFMGGINAYNQPLKTVSI